MAKAKGDKKCKILFTEIFKCPHCSKSVLLRKQKKLVKEAIKAEYEEKLIVDKDEQTTLEESSKGPKLDAKGKKGKKEDD